MTDLLNIIVNLKAFLILADPGNLFNLKGLIPKKKQCQGKNSLKAGRTENA